MVRGLNAGGDDYVVKPAKQQELVARVAAVLRRFGLEDGQRRALRPAALQRRSESAADQLSSDRDIELTPREFELAAFLFRRHGRIVSRDALLENVWNMNASVSTRTVDTHVSRLRKKLELNGEHGWRLSAVYQHGYRLEQA